MCNPEYDFVMDINDPKPKFNLTTRHLNGAKK